MGEDRKIFAAQERAAKAVAGDKARKSADAKKSSANSSKGERNAKKSAASGKRGARLAKAGGAGRSRKSLRAAAARSGRGIAIKNNKTGRGFKGLIQYATDSSKNPKIVFSNCSNDPKNALRTMIRCAELRPEIKNPVGHITLSLPPQNGHGEERWEQIVTELREQLGLDDDSFPVLAVRHADTEHDHVHLIFSRVSIAGKVHDQRNLGLRCAAAEPILEQKFSLPLVPASEFKTARNISKNEIEMGLRKKELPPRLQIAAALKIAVHGRPSTALFCERLQASGIGIKASVASTGKMNGFSFTYDGIAFTASKISKEYGWKALSERIDYDETRDTKFLAELNGEPGTASHDLAAAVATIDALDHAVARVHPATAEQSGNRADPAPAVDRASELLNQNSKEGNQRAETTTERADRADRDAEPVSNRSGDHLSELVEPADLPNHQTASLTEGDSQNGNSRNGYDGYDLYHPEPYSQRPARLKAAATLTDLPNLSPLRLVNHKNGSEKLLQNNASDNVANRPDRSDPVVLGQPGASAGLAKIARPAAAKIPTGFASERPLNLSQRDWVATLPNKISAARSTGQRVLLTGLIDARDRLVVIKSNSGYSIPDLKTITDEQLTALLVDAGNVDQPIKVTGTPDFCQRIDALAKANNLVVVHDHQITDAERLAAQRRYEQRQREEQKHRAEAPAPRPA